jgi:zinc protease
MTRIRSSLPLPASAARFVRFATLAVGLLAATVAAADVPKIQRVVSPGGVEAWLMQYSDAPLITVRLSFAGGTLQPPEGKYGLADMTAYMFDEGAGPYDAAELRRRRLRIGARFAASARSEFFDISFSTPSAHKEEAFELLRLALHQPRFDHEPLARARSEYLANVEAAERQPGSIAFQALNTRVFGGHPFVVDFATMKAGLKGIDRNDMAEFRRRVLARDNVKIAVAGDIDAATLAPLLDRLFGALPAKAQLRPLPSPAGRGGCEVIAMEIPQAIVGFAAVTPSLTWKQRRAGQILQAILNGESRLFKELREKRGLVYFVDTSYTHYDPFGVLNGSFGAAIGDVPQALGLTMAELRRMAAEGPTEEEVATVKRAFIGSSLLGLDTGAALASNMSGAQIDGQPITYIDDFVGEIERIGRDDVWEVAKLLLDPDRFTVVVIGAPTEAKL